MATNPCPICEDRDCIMWNFELNRGVLTDDETSYQLGHASYESSDAITQCALRLGCGISNARGRDISELVGDAENWLLDGCFPEWALPILHKELARDPISLCHLILWAAGEEEEVPPFQLAGSLPTSVACPICSTKTCLRWAKGLQEKPLFGLMHEQMREQFLRESPEVQEMMLVVCAAPKADPRTVEIKLELSEIMADPIGAAERVRRFLQQPDEPDDSESDADKPIPIVWHKPINID